MTSSSFRETSLTDSDHRKGSLKQRCHREARMGREAIVVPGLSVCRAGAKLGRAALSGSGILTYKVGTEGHHV